MRQQFTPPTPEQRKKILEAAEESERLVRNPEREKITALSRSQSWRLERAGVHPKATRLGYRFTAWLLSDLLWFVSQFQTLPTPSSHRGEHD
ncbi:AlpA family phage regulatory protein [Shewanella sp. YLB-09]|nr:AlpA family phage regulatory protein [Shewanella sp. YLB-09]QFU25149.1 AlpA family phage regulatory protein [Shewanella sp. YLB-09]